MAIGRTAGSKEMRARIVIIASVMSMVFYPL